MDKLTKNQKAQLSFMLFGLFFGAGNLIFPPILGREAGTMEWSALLGFTVTAVLLPVMGVIAVAKSNGLHALGKKVGVRFAAVFTAAIYLSIGPGLGIPRAASTPFEMVIAPYVAADKIVFFRLLYTTVFFGVAFWLCLNPKKMVARMGKVLTPLLLSLIVILFVGMKLKNPHQVLAPSESYQSQPLVRGFLEGYNTMDAIAALNFGLVIATAVKNFGVKDNKKTIHFSIQAGVFAGIALVVIYAMLAFVGRTTGGLFKEVSNGADLLTQASVYLFGEFGPLFLGMIFTLACLTTCVGLISSSSQYFATEKFSYHKWVFLWTVLSAILANTGLDWLLAFSVPVLNGIYPMAIVLILLGTLLPEGKTTWHYAYAYPVYLVGAFSLLNLLPKSFHLKDVFSHLPFYDIQLGWGVLFVLGLVGGLIYDIFLTKKGTVKTKEFVKTANLDENL